MSSLRDRASNLLQRRPHLPRRRPSAPSALNIAARETIARQEIEYLRRLYAKATDLLGPGKDHESMVPDTEKYRTQGREIYRRIFAEDASVTAGGSPAVTGPDGWADYVINALSGFTATQHMIGSQLVEIDELPDPRSTEGLGGHATMQSYLNALHESAPGGDIWIVRGTYFDKVRMTPGIGWQIYEMNLVNTSGELRSHQHAQESGEG